MKTLIYKELNLTIPKPVYLFFLLSALMLVPNYPYIVGFGYCFMTIMIAFQMARENKDFEFSTLLPVKRSDFVCSKVLVVVIIEIMQILVSIPFALIAALCIFPNLMQTGNLVGMDANFALYGIVLIAFSVFNLVFLPSFFKSGFLIGPSLLGGVVAFLGVYGAAEVLIQCFAPIRNVIDSLNPAHFGYQILVLIAGILCFCGLLILTLKLSIKKFEKVDL